MLLFRSEEHLERWLTEKGMERGGTMSVATQWALADRWYRNRQSPEWRRYTLDEAHAIFAELGLVGGFWKLG